MGFLYWGWLGMGLGLNRRGGESGGVFWIGLMSFEDLVWVEWRIYTRDTGLLGG